MERTCCYARPVRDAIAAEAGKRHGLTSAQLTDLIRRVSASPLTVFGELARAGIDGEVAVLAAATVTGLAPAPRLLLRNPSIPDHLDGVGIRDAGGAPIGQVQGRVWIAFSDPEAAHAVVFSDDVVVCLALDDDLRLARSRFDDAYPAPASGETRAISPEDIGAFRRWHAQHALGEAPGDAGPVPTIPSTGDQLSSETAEDAPRPAHHALSPAAAAADNKFDDNLFDQPHQPHQLPRSGTAGRTKPLARNAIEPVVGVPGWNQEQLRLLRAAQLGRLKRFQFERVIGSGGMATVYLAHERNGPQVPLAIKLMDPQRLNDAVAVGRFKREVRTLMSLDHPHVVAHIDGDAEASEGVLWLACRYLDGGTLASLMQRTGPLPAPAAIPIVMAVLEGLQYAHGAGVVHRDLKPQNILLGHDGSVCIADFGVARGVDDEPLTRAGVRFGTPAYMSPEQALGDVSDARSDLFSLGVVFYHLLCGDHPFVRGTPAETMKAIAHSDVRSLPAGVHLPPSVRRLLSALLARSVDARPPDAEGALQVLRPIARHLTPVGDVVQALLRDPQAFRDAPPIDDADDADADEADDADTTVGDDAPDRAWAAQIVTQISVDVTLHGNRHPASAGEGVAIANTLSPAPPRSVAVTDGDGEDAPAEPVTTSVDNTRLDALEVVAGAARGERRKRVAVVLLLGTIMLSLVLAMWWATTTPAS